MRWEWIVVIIDGWFQIYVKVLIVDLKKLLQMKEETQSTKTDAKTIYKS